MLLEYLKLHKISLEQDADRLEELKKNFEGDYDSEEWYQSIPKAARPRKDQPFYHLLAENDEITYEAYVSEQNLVGDDPNEPVRHPLVNEIFRGKRGNLYFKPSN